jgi:hypothetical protein
MAWVKLDDQAPRNSKMLKAGPAACWLWVCGIAHAQSQLTDGFIAVEALPMIGITGIGRVEKLAEQLVAVGLFDRADGGYRVHDYLDHNPSRLSVLAKRAEDADRKRRSDSDRIPKGFQKESSAPRADGRRMGWVTSSLEKEEDAERAGKLVERYGELYAIHRHGAQHRARPNLDWSEACSLVKIWDDARLEKLAQIILTTDDPWISNTDRSFKIFALKATWADEKLSAWEKTHGIAS